MNPVDFGIIGGGWRAQFYLRVAQELPEHFRVAGVLECNESKRHQLEAKWNVKTYSTLDEFLKKARSCFVVLSISFNTTAIMLKELSRHSVPVLTETPPAIELQDLIELHELTKGRARIQVAEQYQFQPLNAARIRIAQSGKLGTITQAQVSIAHGFHGISVIRKFLGVQYEDVDISAFSFVAPIVAGPDRSGLPKEEKIMNAEQITAYLDFGGKLGIFEYSTGQYFSWIRSSKIVVRGERGEIHNTCVIYLKDFRTPVTLELKRENAGENENLEGCFHKGILAGEEWVYINPFIPARLSDDEIAVATCLKKMIDYVKGGPEFYSLAQASQDRYIDIMIHESLKKGKKVTTSRQPWAVS